MESRQVALMNLFAGQQWRYRERLVDTVGEGEGGTNEERRKENIHYRMQNRQRGQSRGIAREAAWCSVTPAAVLTREGWGVGVGWEEDL